MSLDYNKKNIILAKNLRFFHGLNRRQTGKRHFALLTLVFLAIGTIFVLPPVYERTALPKRSLSEKATHDLRQAGQQITEAAFLFVFVFHDLGLILGG